MWPAVAWPSWTTCSLSGPASRSGTTFLSRCPDRPTQTISYKAVWLEQGPGTSLRVRKGWIAVENGLSYHSEESRDKAIAGLRRKQRITFSTPAERIQKRLLTIERRYGTVHCTLDDSREAGNCDTGSRSWCARVGIDPERGCNLYRLIGAYRAEPQEGALRVIRLVARRAVRPDLVPVPNPAV